jgi:peptidoglycan/LPS O-acetylase OafA/YrhL
MKSVRGNRTSDHLDLIRGLAALAVLVYHVRYRFFLDYHDLPNPTLLSKVFYVLTAFGHDAVMIFFVLSGYFISASVIRDCRQQRWSWAKYATNRLTRLYLVLLPGLLLTVFWDQLGLACFADHPIYTGVAQPWMHDFFDVGRNFNLPISFGNAVFLQGISVPPLGSNVPLWSLSYEFWYYVLFPCAWLALVGARSWWKRLIAAGGFLVLLYWVGTSMVFYFPIWLFGTAVCLLPPLRSFTQRQRAVATWTALGAFAASLIVVHSSGFRRLVGDSVLRMDYCIGVSFAVFLYLLVQDRTASAEGRYARVASGLASFSYSLYVAHMPLLVFCRAWLVPNEPWRPDLVHLGIGAAISVVGVVYAVLLSRFTEAQTDTIREFFLKQLARMARQRTADRPLVVSSQTQVSVPRNSSFRSHSDKDSGAIKPSPSRSGPESNLRVP